MATILFQFCLSFLPLLVLSQTEEDVLLNIATTCPKTPNDSKHVGQVRVISDFAAVVTLNCLNGNITKKDYAEVSVKFIITINPDNLKDKKDVCVMHRFPKHETYQIEVIVSRRYVLNLYHPDRRFAVFCSYDPFTKSRTKPLNVKSPSSPLRRIFNDNGQRKYVMNMEVVSLNNTVITGTLPLGLKIQLRGHIQRSNTNFSMTVDRCTAFNQLRSYEILRDGHGDGVVLPRDMGFTLVNQSFYSPIFEAFQLRGSTKIQFECTVYFCDAPCRLTSTQHPLGLRSKSEPAPRGVVNRHFKLG